MLGISRYCDGTLKEREVVGPNLSEVEGFSSVLERRANRRPIAAQNTAMARAMASICNAERAFLAQ
jgi:hypothetical protein